MFRFGGLWKDKINSRQKLEEGYENECADDKALGRNPLTAGVGKMKVNVKRARQQQSLKTINHRKATQSPSGVASDDLKRYKKEAGIEEKGVEWDD